ncbi:MAG: hypothetical protein QNI87_05530 [Erythrobacter sp.]|uniref:hypothetical protein n=1 Tax=Erythrobacter sp. TaxID=1042 RepID=UPI00261B234E|nr:hypothetical protein [Erythrobacter sp.]MDJ0977978.1 hypothetical protein [Erythrobacter sp.]
MLRKPLTRRLFAAVLLYGFAIGAVFFWRSEGPISEQGSMMAINLMFATLGLVILHFRWRRQEARVLTPKKAEDIFS